MLRRFIALPLIALLLCGMLFGCAGAGEQVTDTAYSEPPTVSESASPSESPPAETETETDDSVSSAQGIDYDAAYAAFGPNTVMITAEAYTVTWEELYFYLRGNITGLEQSFGEIPDWSEVLYDGMTCEDIVMEYSIENAMMYKAVEYGAKLMDVTLSDEDMAELDTYFLVSSAENGGEEKYMEILREESGLHSRELYDYLVSTSFLAGNLFREMYGDAGAGISDEMAAEYTKDDGYLMAMHILRLKPEEGDSRTDSDALKEAEAILKKLDNYKGDDLGAYFAELMNENSEDAGGLQSYPTGYLFQDGDMVTEFFEACNDLEIGKYSGIVETTYGYHILYRLPVDYDLIPYAYFKYGDYSTLRAVVASALYDAELYNWIDELAPQYSPEFESISIPEIFKIK